MVAESVPKGFPMYARRVVVLLTLLLAACSGGSKTPTPTPPPSLSVSPSLAISPGEAATSTPPMSAVDPCTLRESLEGQALGRSLSFSLGPSTKWQFCLPTFGGAAGSNEKYLFRTTDGGAAWTLISRTTLGNPSPEPGVGELPNGNNPVQVFFLDARHGWLGLDSPGDNLFRTLDGGVTWTVVPGGVGVSTLITSITFVDPMHGTVVTSGGLPRVIVTWSTVDGGVTWTH